MELWACYCISYDEKGEVDEVTIAGTYSSLNNARIAILNEMQVGHLEETNDYAWRWYLSEDEGDFFADGEIYAWHMNFINDAIPNAKDEMFFWIEKVTLDKSVNGIEK